MHNSESVLENETHELIWDFEIQTDHLISARRQKKKQKKEYLPNSGLCHSDKSQNNIKRKSESRDKYLNLARELKTMEHVGDSDPKRIDKGIGRLRNQRKSKDHPNYSITKGIRSEYWEEFWSLEETCCHSDSYKNHQKK